jgi:phage gp29-like protein
MDMARQITNDVIGPLIAYNFGPKASIPRFKFGPLSEANEVNVLDVFSKVATTGAKVPVEFYDQLVNRVATLLELDPGKVAKDLEVNGSPQEQDNLQQMAGVVDSATSMVRNQQAQTEEQKAGGPHSASAKAKARASQGSTSGGGGTVGSRPFGERSVTSAKRRPTKKSA